MNPSVSAVAVNPPWAYQIPPRIDQALVGVVYRCLFDRADAVNEQLELMLGEQKLKRLIGYAAVGPSIWFGRSNCPFVSYSDERNDENLGCLVKERPQPWNRGDVLWELFGFGHETLYVRRNIEHEIDLYFWPTNYIANAASWVQTTASAESNRKAELIY